MKSKYLLLNFRNSGENKMYKLSSAVTGSDRRNINMGPFISYIFIEDEIIVYDDKTVKRKIDENLSNNVKFQKGSICSYLLLRSFSIDDQVNECKKFDWVSQQKKMKIFQLYLLKITKDLTL